MADWERVRNSEIWRGEMLPYLQDMQADLFRQMLNASDPMEMNFLRGKAKAITQLIGQPDLAHAMAEQQGEVAAEEIDGTGRAAVKWFGRFRKPAGA